MGWVFLLWRSPAAQGCYLLKPRDQQEGKLFWCFFVIIFVKVMNTRENLHVVLGGMYSGKELSFLPTTSFPSQRQALFSILNVFFWRQPVYTQAWVIYS